jgi:DNA repair exonuclease SbcCD ATPase subunit/DNA repair exonuclease SbcCD nuclease subunit
VVVVMSDHIGHGRPSEILHIADVHFSASALPYLEEPCAEIVRQAREIRPDAIVIAGDLTTHRGLIDNATAVAARTFVAKLAQIARVYILAGNHDLTFRQGEPNNLRAILSDDTDSVLPNVFVVDRPWVDRWRGINLAFVPYPSIATYHAATGSDDGDDLRLRLVDVVEGLKAQCAEEGGASLAVFHGTVEGGRFGDESSAAFKTRGHDPVLPVRSLAGFDGVACGHLHHPQTIDYPGGVAVYPGCVAPLTYGERDITPTFVVWRRDGDRLVPHSTELPVTYQRRQVEIGPDDWQDDRDAVSNGVMWLIGNGVMGEGTMAKLKITLPAPKLALFTADTVEAIRERCKLHELRIEKTEHDAGKLVLGEGVDRAARVDLYEALRTYGDTIDDPQYREHIDDILGVAGEIEHQIHDQDDDPRYELQPVELVCENYKQYEHLRVDFADLPSSVGVLGPTGTGKTNLMLAIAAALYGGNPKSETGKAKASLASIVRHGATGGKVQFTFRAAEGLFRVTRRYRVAGNGTVTSGLFFEQGIHLGHEEYEWHSIARGSSRETQREIERVVGPPELHWLTRHLRQHGTSHVKMTSSDLADAINATLQLDFEARARLAKDALRDAASQRDAAHTRAETLRGQVVPEDKIVQQERHARACKARAEEEGQQDNELLEKLQEKLDEEVHRKARIESDLDRVRDTKRERERLNGEWSDARAEIERLERRLADIGDVPDVEALEAAVAEAADRKTAAEAELARLKEQAHERDLEAAKTAGALEQSRQAAGHGRANAYRAHDAAKRELERMSWQAALLDEVPCRGETWVDPEQGEMEGGACRLLAEARESSGKLAEQVAKVERLSKKLAEADADYQAAHDAMESHKAAARQDREERDERVRVAADAAAKAASSHGEAERARGRAREKARAAHTCQQRLAPAIERERVLRDQLDRITVNDAWIKEAEAALRQSMERVQALSDEIAERRRRVRQHQDAIVRAERDLEQCDLERMQRHEMLKEIQECERSRDEHERRRVALDYYRRAVDRSGIPSLLLEQLAPQLQARVNDILAPVGRALRVETERQTTTGKTRTEVTLSFRSPSSGDAFVPIAELSGGEEDLANLAMSAGLARVASDMAGTRLSTVILDEPAAGVSESLQGETLEVLTKIVEHVDQAIVITHRRDLASAFDATIEVSQNGAGSVVEVVR